MAKEKRRIKKKDWEMKKTKRNHKNTEVRKI